MTASVLAAFIYNPRLNKRALIFSQIRHSDFMVQ